MDRYAAIEAKRTERVANGVLGSQRIPGAPVPAPTGRSVWAVVKVNDDGRTQIARRCGRADEAERIAGRMRDRMSDAEVGSGWNYLARKVPRS